MAKKTKNLLALDVGEKRIGVAIADSSVKIAIPLETVLVDGNEIKRIYELILRNKIDIVVIGYPRNQQGEPTKQTEFVEDFVIKLDDTDAEMIYQDESLTSVEAEKRLISYSKPYNKAEIDMTAASIILQDYMEENYA